MEQKKEAEAIDTPKAEEPLLSPEQAFKKGVIFFRLDQYQKAFSLFEAAAMQKHAGAQFYLGMRYENGTGVDTDAAKAVEYYQAAAEQGYALAQFNLGLCYQYGIGVDTDIVKAVGYYQAAAKQEHVVAQSHLRHAGVQYNLGFCYENGIGVHKDEAKAIEYYRAAAEQGHAKAQEALKPMRSRIHREDYADCKKEKERILSSLGEKRNHASPGKPTEASNSKISNLCIVHGLFATAGVKGIINEYVDDPFDTVGIVKTVRHILNSNSKHPEFEMFDLQLKEYEKPEHKLTNQDREYLRRMYDDFHTRLAPQPVEEPSSVSENKHLNSTLNPPIILPG